MPVETATYIDDLNALFPAGSESKSEGDNHIRLIKSVLKATLPNATGPIVAAGFAAFATIAAVQAANVPAPVLSLDTAGYTAAGDGGGGQYKRVGSQPTHEGKIQSNDGAWWELVPSFDGINVKQFGAKGDGSTDDATAIMNAANFATNYQGASDGAGPKIHIPATTAHYRCASTLDFQNRVHVIGQSYQLAEQGQLHFDADTAGIVFNAADTTLDTTRTPGNQAAYSRLENIAITCATPTARNAAKPGIRVRTKVHFSGVVVRGFPGSGFHIHCTAGGGTNIEGNSNYSYFERCTAQGNYEDGFSIFGADANAMTFVMLNAQNNGRFGVDDDSLLGNHYFGLHLAGNGKPGLGGNTSAQSSLCSHGGNRYYAVYDATETQLRTTTPGTNNAVWRFLEVGGANTTYLTWTGQPTGTFFNGGSFKAEGSVNATYASGLYFEGDQGPPYVGPEAAIHGGELPARAYGEGVSYSGKNILLGGLEIDNNFDTDSDDLSVELRYVADAFVRFKANNASAGNLGLVWEDAYAGDGSFFKWIHGSSTAVMRITCSDSAILVNGVNIGAGHVSFPNGIWVGDFTDPPNSGLIVYRNAVPSSGNWRRGTIVFNSEPSNGEVLGWICLSSGNPGIWATLATVTQI